jgi:hypothetical protein
MMGQGRLPTKYWNRVPMVVYSAAAADQGGIVRIKHKH